MRRRAFPASSGAALAAALALIGGLGMAACSTSTPTGTPSSSSATTSPSSATTAAGAGPLTPRGRAFRQCVARHTGAGGASSTPSTSPVAACLLASLPGAKGGRASTGLETPLRSPNVPRFAGDFADPSLLVVSATQIYVYATNTPQANVPVLRGTVGGSGTLLGDALPALPSWTEPGSVWAPSVREVGAGSYVLYYATRDDSSGRQCISVATGSQPAGPFVDRSSGPLVCQLDLGGSIDPSTYTSGATTYLIWKSDGNCCGLPTELWSAALSADGMTLTGAPVMLLRDDQAWEDGVIEGPSMAMTRQGLQLYFSGGLWDTSGYGMAVAACATPLGPCHDTATGPFLHTRPGEEGPGGGSVVAGPAGNAYIVYSAWTNGKVGYPAGGARSLFAARLNLSAAEPVVP